MEVDEEEEKLYRELELKYEKLYSEVYEERKQLLSGKAALSEAYLSEYEARAKVLDDEDFKKVEVNAVDVKEI